MSLAYRGPGGTVEYRWIAYALLRDNVVHHLEDGAATRFPLLHRIGEALGGETVRLDAVALRAEAEEAARLLERPIADLAVSRSTRSLLCYALPPPGSARETELASACGFAPKSVVPHSKSLDDAFGYLVRGLLTITEGAVAGGTVEVIDL